MTAGLCSNGRCAAILAAVAERDAQQVDRHVRQWRAILGEFVGELGLTQEQQARVPSALRTAIDAVVAAGEVPARSAAEG